MLKRGVCVVLLICGWSLEAAASITMNPSPFDAGTAQIGSTTMADGTLSSTTNVHVDIDITNNCIGGGGTFALSATQNVNLNSPASLTLSYTPSARGTRTCRVDVFDTGTTNLLGSFNVRGTGHLPPTMSVSGNPDFGSLRFNNAAPNHTSSRSFTVSNGGDETLDISSVAISGANAADFTITAGGTTAAILPGNSKTWSVAFDPSASGTRTATLTFTANDPVDPTDTVNLTGVGTNAVIQTPTNADFGIVNITSSALANVQVTNGGGSPKGPLGVTSATITGGAGWITFAGCGGGTTCNFSPALAIQDTTNVGVQCTPPATAAANDTQMATITFTSDTDTGGDNTATLTCVAGKSALATNFNTALFGSALVGTTTNQMPITVTNTGNVATTFYLTKTGTAQNQSAFTLSTPTGCGMSSSNPCTVPANNGTATINVQFTALYEGDINAGLVLTSPSTPNPSLVLTGRGIDRHIQLIDSVQFPDTFRNPGDMATLMPVTVRNIGEYPLHVTSVMLDGAGNWELAEPFQPFDVAGLSSHDVNVKFVPVAAGKAPDGILAVMSDDPKSPLLNVIVSGNGKDRNVAFGPTPIDFGNTGAGVPVALTSIKTPDNWLTVTNMDEADFKIRKIEFDMPTVFKAQTIGGDSVDNVDLPVAGSKQFEIVFLPPKVGDYTSTMTLYLDQDPIGQRFIEVHGNALFVDAHGGGGFGCSTGHGAGSGVLLALALLRRKRRRG